MSTKKIELDRIARRHVLPTLAELQKDDKNIKKILHITLKGDKIIAEVEVEAPKRKPNALKEVAKPKTTTKASTRSTTAKKKTSATKKAD